MIKYIWITVAVIVAILALALKQAPKEEPIATESTDQTAAEEQAALPAVSESGNIKVSAPQPESLVSSPLLIKGQARAFESTFQIVLKDGNNKEVAKKTATYTSADPSQFGDYGELLLFDAPGTDQGTLEVFTNSAKDGTVQDLVTIPIKFK
ncbi:MAG: Gmad2 immunoglobulin-like domain-containing protein [Candidatus Komeilibacteria bacterium]|nr:Gmad2 immunoglobulin-like domain-containing protein [Candidatus Komeilibacteria bacterium]